MFFENFHPFEGCYSIRRFLFSAFSCLDAEKTGEREGKESEGLRQVNLILN